MRQRFDNFVKQIEKLCENTQLSDTWMDSTEVCLLLQTSPRTLQSYRDNGILPYSQIGRKSYYKTTDIEQLISQSQIKK